MQLLLKAIRLHGFQLSSLSLIMDVFETSACHTIYLPRPRPRYYHSKSQISYPSNTDSISSSSPIPLHSIHRTLHTTPLTEFAHITLKSTLPLYHSPSTQHGAPPCAPVPTPPTRRSISANLSPLPQTCTWWASRRRSARRFCILLQRLNSRKWLGICGFGGVRHVEVDRGEVLGLVY